MPPVQLTQLGPDASVDEVVETVSIDGAVIVEGVLSPENLALLDTELTPWITQTNNGRDDFSGRSTTRTGALVARSPACRNIVMHKLGLAVAEQFLAAYTNRIQLHLTQVIRLKGGQGSQPLHRDRPGVGWLRSPPDRASTQHALGTDRVHCQERRHTCCTRKSRMAR